MIEKNHSDMLSLSLKTVFLFISFFFFLSSGKSQVAVVINDDQYVIVYGNDAKNAATLFDEVLFEDCIGGQWFVIIKIDYIEKYTVKPGAYYANKDYWGVGSTKEEAIKDAENKMYSYLYEKLDSWVNPNYSYQSKMLDRQELEIFVPDESYSLNKQVVWELPVMNAIATSCINQYGSLIIVSGDKKEVKITEVDREKEININKSFIISDYFTRAELASTACIQPVNNGYVIIGNYWKKESHHGNTSKTYIWIVWMDENFQVLNTNEPDISGEILQYRSSESNLSLLIRESQRDIVTSKIITFDIKGNLIFEKEFDRSCYGLGITYKTLANLNRKLDYAIDPTGKRVIRKCSNEVYDLASSTLYRDERQINDMMFDENGDIWLLYYDDTVSIVKLNKEGEVLFSKPLPGINNARDVQFLRGANGFIAISGIERLENNDCKVSVITFLKTLDYEGGILNEIFLEPADKRYYSAMPPLFVFSSTGLISYIVDEHRILKVQPESLLNLLQKDVENNLTNWEKRGSFETSQQWKDRLESMWYTKRDQFIKEAVAKWLPEFDNSIVSKPTYNADNQKASININDLGYFQVMVSTRNDEARRFINEYKDYNVDDVYITKDENGTWQIVSINLRNKKNGNTYTAKSKYCKPFIIKSPADFDTTDENITVTYKFFSVNKPEEVYIKNGDYIIEQFTLVREAGKFNNYILTANIHLTQYRNKIQIFIKDTKGHELTSMSFITINKSLDNTDSSAYTDDECFWEAFKGHLLGEKPSVGLSDQYFACIIANEEYDDTTKNLEGAIEKAELLKKILEEQYQFKSENVVLLKNLSSDQFDDFVQKKIRKGKLCDTCSVVGRNSSILFYYIGHGSGNKKLIMTNDIEISPNEIFEEMAKVAYFSSTNSILYIEDACYGTCYKNDGAPLVLNTKICDEYNGFKRTLLQSRLAINSSSGRISLNMNFTSCFIDVLNNNQNDYITIDEIFSQIRTYEKVRSEVSFNKLNGHEDGGTFVLIKKDYLNKF
jgi:hypothetical protein